MVGRSVLCNWAWSGPMFQAGITPFRTYAICPNGCHLQEKCNPQLSRYIPLDLTGRDGAVQGYIIVSRMGRGEPSPAEVLRAVLDSYPTIIK